jgi:uncharacterized protein YjbJ (UPF0337 family)
MEDKIRGKAEELKGKLTDDKSEEFKGKGRQEVGNLKQDASDLGDAARDDDTTDEV